MKQNRKSQGNAIVIVLVIAMVLAGIVVLWNIVYPMVQQKSSEADTSIFSINLNIKEVILSETGASKITVQRTSGEGTIGSLKFIFYDEGGQSYTSSQDTDMPKELETKTYSFSPIPNIKKFKGVSVVPVVNNKLGREFKFNSQVISSFPQGLVSWWKFDDKSDLVGGNNGETQGNAVISNGNLILISAGYFDINDQASLDMNSKFAISAWIKANNFGGKIISKDQNYEVYLTENGKVGFVYGGNNRIESFRSIILGDKTHIVVSIDNQGNLGKISINGNEEVNYLAFSPELNNVNVKIGEGFNGEIEDFMLFNKTLSRENIDFLYKNQAN